jgi:hypothetical protein
VLNRSSTLFDKEGFAFNERLCDFPPHPPEDPADGRPGHFYTLGRLFVIKAVSIDEAQGFEFIEMDFHLFQLGGGHAGGLKNSDAG